MTAATETMTAAGTPAEGTCRYPGCANLARSKDPAAPGPRPGYCGQDVPEDRADGTLVRVRHTALAAFRRRRQLAGQPAQDRPVTSAVSRAAAIRSDALAAMTRLAAQLSAALDQLAGRRGQQRTARPVQPRLGFWRRNTATSSRSTSNSTSFDAAEPASSTIHPAMPTSIK